MLDSYFQEKHVVLEEEVCKASQQHTSGAAGHASNAGHNGKKAVEIEKPEKAEDDLEKYMVAVTDFKILKQGRKDQKGESLLVTSVSRC
jgi:hypothetical protein